MKNGMTALLIMVMAGNPLVVPSADADEKDSAELRALREQVAAIQSRIEILMTRDTPSSAQHYPLPAAKGGSSAPMTPASSPYGIRYKGVSITLGGFVAAEYIYRQRNQENDISTNFNAIPYANGTLGHTNELRFTARQTRLSALVQGNPEPATLLSLYSELDFQGGAQTANSNQSNSYNPRVRHLYGAVDWESIGLHVIAGQTWSLVTLNTGGITPRNELLPPTIDGQYLPGFSWARQPQFRITKSFGPRLWIATSFENPQTTFYTGANPLPSDVHLSYSAPAGQGFDSANTLSLNHIPDIVKKIVYEAPIGERSLHLEIFGIYRSFYERLDFHNRNASGGGGGAGAGAGAGIELPIFPKLLDLEISGMAGKGLGRYGSAQLPDVTLDPSGAVRPIHEVQMLAGLTLHASPTLDIYLFAGEERESAEAYTLESSSGPLPYGYGNPAYLNTGCFSETAVGPCVGNTRSVEQATTGFWYKPYVGNFGAVRCGLQYSHTERKAFNGVGGAPMGDQNIVLASIRYYPF
jgi:hypothetical protein